MVRISLGLVSLTLSILFASRALGLLPDQEGAVLHGRKALCEALAISCSQAAQQNDLPTLEATVRAIAARNPDVHSIGIRAAGGKLLVEVGEHEGPWQEGAGERSTPTHLHLPIALEDKLWGRVEVRFEPLGPTGARALVQGPMFRLGAFFLGVGS